MSSTKGNKIIEASGSHTMHARNIIFWSGISKKTRSHFGDPDVELILSK
jgi:hypothetical protein